MNVQPAFSIAEAVVGTRPAGAGPAVGAPQEAFATLLAALVGAAPGAGQPPAAGIVLGQPRASRSPGEAQAADGTPVGPDVAFLVPDQPAALGMAPAVVPGPDLTAQPHELVARPGQSAPQSPWPADVSGPEPPFDRPEPAPALHAARTSAIPHAGRELAPQPVAGQPGPPPGGVTSVTSAGRDLGPEPTAGRPEPVPASHALSMPAAAHAGLEASPEHRAVQSGPAPAFEIPRPPGAPRAPHEAGIAPGRPMASRAVAAGTPQPEAGQPRDPGARPEFVTRGGAGQTFPDPASGPEAHLEPGEVTLVRGERFTPAPASLPARPATEGMAGQIGIQIARAASRELRQVVVQLEPAELGRVHIRLDFAGHGGMKAVIAAERLETLELLQRDAPALERSLQEAGLRLDSGGVGFSLRRERGEHGRDQDPATQTTEPASSPQPGTAAGRLALTVRLLDLHA